MKIIYKQDFTEEQFNLAEELKEELETGCHSLEEFSEVNVFGLTEDETGEKSILFDIGYSDPEKDGRMTIFNCY